MTWALVLTPLIVGIALGVLACRLVFGDPVRELEQSITQPFAEVNCALDGGSYGQ